MVSILKVLYQKNAIVKTIDPDILTFNDNDLDDMYNSHWLDYDAPDPKVKENLKYIQTFEMFKNKNPLN